jgi:RNA polymerase sigma-70 factor (ECF subfamily)
MDDVEIIALFEQRKEEAVAAAARKYGGYCQTIARNLLSFEDAEECVSDAWLAAWNRIPPAKPESLRAFLGKITRTLAISRWRGLHAQKRGGGLTLLLSELEDCLPDPVGVEEAVETRELARLLSDWLRALPQEDRVWFLRRYWYGAAVRQLAAETGCTENQMAQRMRKLRQALRAKLEQEGIAI